MICKTLTLAVFSAVLATSAFADYAGRSGQFTGASDHVTSGTVTITKDADGYIVQLGLARFEIEGIWRRIQNVIERVDEGEIPVFEG